MVIRNYSTATNISTIMTPLEPPAMPDLRAKATFILNTYNDFPTSIDSALGNATKGILP